MERHGLGSRYQRLLKLEEQHLREGKKLSQEQIKSIEKANPCFKERHVECKAPGCLLCQDTLYAGKLKEVGKVYMQTVVATYGSFAFGSCTPANSPTMPPLSCTTTCFTSMRSSD